MVSAYWTSFANSAWHSLVAYSLPDCVVEFDSAPASGAVITIDYDTECIAKDANHVFDISFEIILGEKVS